MTGDEYRAWDECPESDSCELVLSFLELVDAMVHDIQHMKAETIRVRYRLGGYLDPEHKLISGCDILSGLDMPHDDRRMISLRQRSRFWKKEPEGSQFLLLKREQGKMSNVRH